MRCLLVAVVALVWVAFDLVRGTPVQDTPMIPSESIWSPGVPGTVPEEEKAIPGSLYDGHWSGPQPPQKEPPPDFSGSFARIRLIN
jgi:hypothetical protein